MALLDAHITKLENGITVVVIPKTGMMVDVNVWIKDGSRNDEAPRAGELHLLEHAVFKGTKKFPHWQDVNQILRCYGREDNIDAATDYEYVQFSIRGMPEQLEEMTFLLSELILRPKIVEYAMNHEIAKEKLVILEEHNWYLDDFQHSVVDNVWKMMYRDHPLGQPIEGTSKTIGSIKRKHIVRRWRRFFLPDNILIVIQGNVGERIAVKCVKLNFTVKKRKCLQESVIWVPPSFKFQPLDQRIKLESRTLQKFYVAIGWPTRGFRESYRYALWTLSRILGEGMGSILMAEIREKHGIGYQISSEIVELSDAGAFLIRGHFIPTHLIKAIRLMRTIWKGLLNKIEIDVLESAKSSIIADLYNWVEMPAWISRYIYYQWLTEGQNWVTGSRIEPVEKIIKMIKAVNVEDINKAIRKILTSSKLYFSTIGPFNAKLEKEVLQILKAWE